MKKFILLTNKAWHSNLFEKLFLRKDEIWTLIKDKENFNIEFLNNYNPHKIFIPHWSHIIPEEIWGKYECVVFHMTDLPYGRGGSPLQNLILRGHTETKISAIKVNKGLDTGDIYLKKPLSLEGTAREIFERATPIIHEMIEEIIDNHLLPQPQQGEPTNFKRRNPKQGSLEKLSSLEEIFNYIRMLDCEGYPNAFLETESFKIEFRNASLINNEITANVRITKK